MTETVSFSNNRHPTDQERDINGYYDVNVTQPYDEMNAQFNTQTVVKVKQKISPAAGTSEVKIGISIAAESEQSITIPTAGFTVMMKVGFVSRVGDTLQALFTPVDRDSLIRVGANYVDMMLVTIPFTKNDYINLRPNTFYYITIDQAQPEVTPISDDSLVLDPVVQTDPTTVVVDAE